MYFQGSDVDEKDADVFAPLPEGVYRVYVDQAATKENKNFSGYHVSVTLKVIEGQYEGRLIFQKFNIKNANAKAEQIGKAQFKKMLMGLKAPVDLASEAQMKAAVEGKTLYVKVGQRKRKDTGEFENTIKDWAAAPAGDAAAAGYPPSSIDSVPW